MTLPIIISIINLVLFVLAFVYFRAYIKQRTSFDGILKDVRDEVNSLLRRIDEITEKDISLVEDRENSLRTLLEECDRRLSILNRELDRRESAEKTYREIGRSQPVIELKLKAPPAETKPEASESTQSLEDKISELVRSGFSPAVIASRLGISVTEAELAVALIERKSFREQ